VEGGVVVALVVVEAVGAVVSDHIDLVGPVVLVVQTAFVVSVVVQTDPHLVVVAVVVVAARKRIR